ncbi:MAG TPA: hypothetical protein VEY91_07275 [Candidatus Limnocylindria bacterium]|nr:hypothetical protein [Candidatus Limnocylindria bacterium]
MTVGEASDPTVSRTTGGDIALDGLFTGMIGALAVAVWFLILDILAGRPLYTPALLGTVLLHGGQAVAQEVTIAALEVAAYTAFHFVAFLIVGLGFSYSMNLFEKFPITGFVLLVIFLCLQLGFFVLDVVLGVEIMGLLRPWTVVVGNLLAAGTMGIYLWRRHPRIKQRLDHIWEGE